MSIAKVTEITSISEKSFDDALKNAVKRANKTLKNVKSIWVKDQEASVRDGKITTFRLTLKVTFVLK